MKIMMMIALLALGACSHQEYMKRNEDLVRACLINKCVGKKLDGFEIKDNKLVCYCEDVALAPAKKK